MHKVHRDYDDCYPSFSPDITKSQESLLQVFGAQADAEKSQNGQLSFDEVMDNYMMKNNMKKNGEAEAK